MLPAAAEVLNRPRIRFPARVASCLEGACYVVCDWRCEGDPQFRGELARGLAIRTGVTGAFSPFEDFKIEPSCLGGGIARFAMAPAAEERAEEGADILAKVADGDCLAVIVQACGGAIAEAQEYADE